MRLPALLLALALTSQGPAQDTPPWTLYTITGERLEGRLRLGEDGQIHVLGSAGERILSLDDVQRLEHTLVRPREVSERRRVWLRSGVELPMSSAIGAGRELRVSPPFAQEPVSFGLPLIAALRISGESVETDFEEQLGDPGESSDYLYLLDEGKTTRLSVIVKSLGEDSPLVVEFSGSDRPVPWELVYGIIFARDSGAAPDRQPKPRVRIVLTGGGQIEGRLVALDEHAALRLDGGGALRIYPARILAIHLATDKLLYLTDTEPASEEHTPALDRTWPWIADKSPAGGAILLGGREYAKGLVLFPRTSLTFDLQGQYDFFETVIGIEDRGGPQAHAIFRVIADDEVVFESRPFTLGMKPEPLRIDIVNVRRLTLEADFGENLDLGDHCVFADARVIKG